MVLTGTEIVVVETKKYSGRIYASQKEPNWTVVNGKSKYTIQNPLRQNYLHIEAVKAHCGVSVAGVVVMAGTAAFPKGVPEGVIFLNELPIVFQNRSEGRKMEKAVTEAWDKLLWLKNNQDSDLGKVHLRLLREKHGAGKSRLLVKAALAASFGWMLFLLIAG